MLIRALAASALIHAVLLVGVISLLPARLEAPAVSARIRMSGSDLETAVRRDVAKHVLAGVDSAAIPVPLAAPPGKVQRHEFAPLVSSTTGSAPDGTRSVRRIDPDRSADRPSRTRQDAQEGVSADDLRQYRVSLAVAARGFKRYPALARERGWEGTVELAVTTQSHRLHPEVSILHTSGHALLDEEAQEMLRKAVGVTTLPGDLQGRNFRMILPVQFGLGDES